MLGVNKVRRFPLLETTDFWNISVLERSHADMSKTQSLLCNIDPEEVSLYVNMSRASEIQRAHASAVYFSSSGPKKHFTFRSCWICPEIINVGFTSNHSLVLVCHCNIPKAQPSEQQKGNKFNCIISLSHYQRRAATPMTEGSAGPPAAGGLSWEDRRWTPSE